MRSLLILLALPFFAMSQKEPKDIYKYLEQKTAIDRINKLDQERIINEFKEMNERYRKENTEIDSLIDSRCINVIIKKD